MRSAKPPFYVGLSATIGNARNLAALLFNVHPDRVLYLHDTEERPYIVKNENHIARKRLHFLLIPNMFVRNEQERVYPQTAMINTISAIGHALRDPQFRKILVFCNFKADHDKLSFQIPENERDYVAIYRNDVQKMLLDALARGARPMLDKSNRSVIRQVGRWYEWEQKTIAAYAPELEVGWHRGALEMEKRVRAVNRFASLDRIHTGDQARGFEDPIDVMVATKTLELGIDIGNVSVVMNSSAPFSNNDYVQRIGRGGRRKDSLAITIINPNNAIDAYLREHFREFVFPTQFEDAPIIASNELIMAGHIRARVLDYFAKVVGNGYTIKVSDWTDHGLPDGSTQVNIRDNPDRYAELMFDRIFPSRTFGTFQRWFEIEAQVLWGLEPDPQIQSFRVDREWVIGVLRQVCREFYKMTDPRTPNAWDRDTLLAGAADAAFKDLHPSLRGSGKSVGLYLKKSHAEDEWKDEISRDRAIYQNPPGSYQSQGRNLFVIESIRTEDEDAEQDIAELLVDNPSAYDYFLRHFPDSSLQNPPQRYGRWRLKTPDDLLVRHFPGRYHCSNERCGLTYTAGEVTDDLKCLDCGWDLHQVTRVYQCPQCHALAEPPVPKLCINPACIRDKLDKDQRGGVNNRWNLRIAVKTAIARRDPKALRGFFRFKSRPNLEWECLSCHSIISFHRRDANHFGIPALMPDNGNLDGTESDRVIAWYALYRPEMPIRKKSAYQEAGYHLNGYNCPDIENCKSKWAGGLYPVNLPRHQTDVVQFHIAQRDLGPQRGTRLGDIHLLKGDVVSIAERHSLSNPKEDDSHAVDPSRQRIFEDGALFATKFSPHLFGLKIRERIDAFLERVPCATTSCTDCAEINQIELGDLYRPQMALAPRSIENGKPVQPDPRAVWCDVNRAGHCFSLVCNGCEFFRWNSLRRFAVLHTLKHGIVWALPKYTGLDVGSFKGVVNPGFLSKVAGVPNDMDLLVIDMNDGGSGAIYLVDRWWESHIEPMAIEILRLAALPSTDERHANLNLPYTCGWFNTNLCPVLTGKFVATL